jgi:glycosyltransferase involved in cell wall biosynthesis
MASNCNRARLVIQWPSFGPYHVARLNAARSALDPEGVEVIGLAISDHDKAYLWSQANANQETDCVVFRGSAYAELPAVPMCHGIACALARLQPDVVAANGYSSSDALTMLAWSCAHRRGVILMSESKDDDARRIRWREWFKRCIVRRYGAALCGGQPQRGYLLQLGMQGERIFDGYDVVDNDFFQRGADEARREPERYRTLPGLASPEPYLLASARFLPRKNLDGLLRAYARYREMAGAQQSEQVWRLVILGDGVERERLCQLIAADEIAGVTFAGVHRSEELPAYYGLASAFVHAARQEQWGLVVNEAMAAGLPVLVSDRCGCVPDLVCEGLNGFTFDPDDEGSLARLIHRMSSGAVDLAALGEASRRHIAAWGVERFGRGICGAWRAASRRSAALRQQEA